VLQLSHGQADSRRVLPFSNIMLRNCSPVSAIFSPNVGDAFFQYPPVEVDMSRFTFKPFKLIGSQNVVSQLVAVSPGSLF
jgi:hypothetical protein